MFFNQFKMRHSFFSKSLLFLRFLNQIVVVLLLLSNFYETQAIAARPNPSDKVHCNGQKDKLAHTVYYVPDVRKICGSSKICPKFRADVKMQGTGSLGDGRVLRYNGKTEKLAGAVTRPSASVRPA